MSAHSFNDMIGHSYLTYQTRRFSYTYLGRHTKMSIKRRGMIIGLVAGTIVVGVSALWYLNKLRQNFPFLKVTTDGAETRSLQTLSDTDNGQRYPLRSASMESHTID